MTTGAPVVAGSGRDILKSIDAFASLHQERRRELLDVCELASFNAGARICSASEPWHALYVVLSGKVRLIDDRSSEAVPLDTLARGAHFGERSILYGEAGSFSADCLAEVTLLKLAKQTFDAFLDAHPDAARSVNEHLSQAALRSFLAGSTIFSSLGPEELTLVAGALKHKSLRAGEFLIREGDTAKELFIVEEGQFRVYRSEAPEEPLAVVRRGEVVGETALLRGLRRNANVVAEVPSTVFVLPGDVFLTLVQSQTQLAASMEALIRQRTSASTEIPAELEPPEAGQVADRLEWIEPPYIPPRRFGLRRGKPALVRQQSVMDCGAACLATVVLHYGKRVSLNRMRELARVGTAGASMLHLVEAAKEMGFETIPVLGTYEHLQKNHLPAIVNWCGYHWIVVHAIDDNRVVVADPAQGIVELRKGDFLANWTLYTIYLRPTERFAQVIESPPALTQFRTYLHPYRRLLYEIALASLTLQIFSLAAPMFTKFVIDDVITKGEQRWLMSALVAMSAITLLQLALGYFRQRILLYVSLRLNVRLLTDFYRQVLSLPIPFFESRKVGDVVTRFEENIKISSFFTGTGLDFFIDTITAFLYLGLMFYYNVQLTLVSLAFVSLHIVNLRLLTPYLQHAYRDVFQKSTEVHSHTIESVQGLRTIKVLGIEHFVRWTWENLFARFTNSLFKTIKYQVVSGLASQLVNHSSAVAILFYGAWLVLQNRLTLGELVAFTVLGQAVSGPITKVVQSWDRLQETLNAVERLNDVYEAKPEIAAQPPANSVVLPALRGTVRFDNVTFRYGPGSKNVLQNISLEIKPGHRIAFVGRSGSGKSTFSKLILGFYRPSSGSIHVDGFLLDSLWLPSLRRQIGVVPPDSFLFRGTIRENICRARPEAAMTEVTRAARLAAAHDFIAALPAGYETMLEEGATNLSGGQRQRISLARCLLQNPRMLILDEATSALDNETERLVMRNLAEAFSGRTILMIAHRLSTVRNADLIAVLDRGNIIETGNHDQLMAQRGMYYFLSTQQLNL